MVSRKAQNRTSKRGKSPQLDAAARAEIAEETAREARYQRNKTDEFIVAVLTGERVPQEVIAKALNRPWGVSVETMLRHYAREVAVGKATLLTLAYGRLLREIGDGTVDNPGSKAAGTRAAIFIVERMSDQLSRLASRLPSEGKAATNKDIGAIKFTLNLGEKQPDESQCASTAGKVTNR